jgi:hypothetical protein
MIQFICECCKEAFDLDKAVILNAGGTPYYICEECDGRCRSTNLPPSENTCVCCGEIIPEGRQVCPNCEKDIEEASQ